MKYLPYLLVFLVVTVISGCSKNEEEVSALTVVSFERADECHLCGMIIEGFAGPKGAATGKTDSYVRKFCSTRDLFSYYLDPENNRNVKQLLVHDMSQVPWDSPEDEQLIDAKKAWFVSGSSKKGAMGLTLASFAKQESARMFAEEFGGEVLTFEQVTPQIINGF